MTPSTRFSLRQAGRTRLLMMRTVVELFLLCSVLLIVASGCQQIEPANAKAEKPPLPEIEVECLVVQPQAWPLIARSQGNMMADEVTEVGTRVAGRIAEIHVDLGDLVELDQPLATLETSEFKLLVEQAEAELLQTRAAVGLLPGEPTSKLDPQNAPPVRQEKALWEEAKTKLARTEKLASELAVAAVEIEQVIAAERVAEARYSASLNGVREKIALIAVREAELSLAKQRLLDATIRAPFSGQVQRRATSPGTYVNVGDSIATMVRTDLLRFRGSLPERYARKLAIGQDIELSIESVADVRNVAVTRISPMLDPLSRSLIFEAIVENPSRELHTGLFAEANITVDASAQAIVIPLAACVQFAGAEKVWKVVDGVAAEQEIFLGTRREPWVEVLSGLESGDIIIKDASQGSIAKVIAKPPLQQQSPSEGSKTNQDNF